MIGGRTAGSQVWRTVGNLNRPPLQEVVAAPALHGGRRVDHLDSDMWLSDCTTITIMYIRCAEVGPQNAAALGVHSPGRITACVPASTCVILTREKDYGQTPHPSFSTFQPGKRPFSYQPALRLELAKAQTIREYLTNSPRT